MCEDGPGVWVDPTLVISHMCRGDRETGSAQDDPFPSSVSQGPRGPGGVRSLPTERAAHLVRRDCWGEQRGRLPVTWVTRGATGGEALLIPFSYSCPHASEWEEGTGQQIVLICQKTRACHNGAMEKEVQGHRRP